MESYDKFKEEIRNGLSARPKYIPSKYFYDDRGSRLFQKIMKLPGYYLTDCELEIFHHKKEQFLKAITGSGDNRFDLVELGAGDGIKTEILIRYFTEQKIDFRYFPVDISSESNRHLFRRLKSTFPDLDILPVSHEYLEALEKINAMTDRRKVLLFLGSNVGNMDHESSVKFFQRLASGLKTSDLLIIGFDLIKDPEVILPAYNDSEGVTSDFNLNLLTRINREMEADFNLKNFVHHPVYNIEEGAAKSYLKSTIDQEVYIGALRMSIHFRKGELIFTEISRKYDPDLIQQLAIESGFRVLNNLSDNRKYFINSIWIYTR